MIVTGENEGASTTGGVVRKGNVEAVLATAVGTGPIEVEGCELAMKGIPVVLAGGPIEVTVGPGVVGGAHCQFG